VCGIAGHLSLTGAPADRQFVADACAAMRHRGPDEFGLTGDARHEVALGIARLRVLGLVGGSQPARDASGRVLAVVNGEIYNHHELRRLLAARERPVRGTSDVHVVPELYREFGDEFVHHLLGMFAIALYDTERSRLLLVSDRLGKKPLFYGELAGGGIAFASELRALFATGSVSRTIDPVAVDQYLSYRIVPAPRTIYRDVRKLRPATVMCLDRTGIRERVYWDQPFDGSLGTAPRAEIVEQVDTLLGRAVADRLESDVPLGAMLSGGLDSSLVVALARRSLPAGLHTFSVGFDSPAFDETRAAEAVATYCGTRHHSRVVTAADAARVADRILDHVGEPYAFPSAVASWVMYELAGSEVTVVLTGDGSDEMFCGYRRYRRLAGLPAGGELADRYESVLLDGVSTGTRTRLYHPAFRATLPDFPVNYLRERFDRTDPSAPDLERAMQVDATFWLSDAQLVKIDRMAMAHSVEPRSPMLDHRLVEYVRRIPAELELAPDGEKLILQDVASRHLPMSSVRRRKQELAVPLEQWLARALRPRITATLLSEQSLERGYFAPDRLRRFVTDFRPADSYPLWTLYMLERFHRRHVDRPDPEPASGRPTLTAALPGVRGPEEVTPS
jgi:asparagine synthase (glutamine-hydrolysing)